ncbi:hypothetical protein HDK90DRAFT_468383 [Phyllosticta capitalensis]|uniref:Rhodopsin domain-containing protein n=1 Tax=Phyllosticta capitalensis TaxID=121624 RepID=A0ABR1YGU5_9PEZI
MRAFAVVVELPRLCRAVVTKCGPWATMFSYPSQQPHLADSHDFTTTKCVECLDCLSSPSLDKHSSGMIVRDNAHQLVIIALVQGIPALILFGLRVLVRTTRASWGYDDWAMVAAAGPFAVQTVGVLLAAKYGIGFLDKNLDPHKVPTALMWFFWSQVLFLIAVMFIKVSIALQLSRIATSRQKYVYAIRACLALVVVSHVATIVFVLARCHPMKAHWTPSLVQKQCGSQLHLTIVSYVQAAINIGSDMFCAMLPIPLLWNVRMNRKTKSSVIVLLGMGVFASVSAMVRLKYNRNYMYEGPNRLWRLADIVTWAYSETGMGMIIGCSACLRPLLPALRSEHSQQSHETYRLESGKPPHGGVAVRDEERESDSEMETPGGASFKGREGVTWSWSAV